MVPITPTHTPGRLRFGKARTFYKATVTRNGKVVAALKGKLNTEADLQTFLKEHWPYDLKWHAENEFLAIYKLEIKKYWGAACVSTTTAQSPGA